MDLKTKTKVEGELTLFDMIRQEVQGGGLRNRHPDDGKYKVMAVMFSFAELKEDKLPPLAGTCTAQVIIEGENGKVWTWNRVLEDVLPDLLHKGSKIEYGEVELSYCAIRNRPIPRNNALDYMNKLSPERDSLAISRIEFLDAIGAHHLVELEPNKRYMISGMEIKEVLNPTLNKRKMLLHVRLLPAEDKGGEAKDAELFMYFDENKANLPLIERTYKFFESRMGMEISPRTPFPVVLGIEDTRILEHLFCEEPKFKKGELYVLDRVMKGDDGISLVIEAHNLKDHEVFRSRYTDWEAVLKHREDIKSDPAEEEKATIRLKVQTYGDSSTTSWSYRRKQTNLYDFFKKFEVDTYAKHGEPVVFSPVVNIYNNTLDLAEAPTSSSGMGIYFGGVVSLNDKAAMDAISKTAIDISPLYLIN